MKRRGFFLATGVAGSLGGTLAKAGAGELGPRDLREFQPIGLAAPEPGATLSETVARCPVWDLGRIKILQLTDLHFFCDRVKHGEAADQRTLEDIGRLVARHQPDLIAFSGDVWHDPAPGKSREIFDHALASMSRWGVPWLFVWGNHDLLEDVPLAQKALTDAPGSLYRGAYAGGNYRVALENANGETLWDLVCLNTTTQGVQKAQEDWLQAQRVAKTAKDALCFLHIPVLQYHTLWESGDARGVKQEEVCTYGEDGSAIAHLRRLKVRACFCGHDHVNDYGGTLEGVDLVYGRATGHAGYGGEDLAKGGKLITLNSFNRSWVWETVFADGRSWMP